TWSRAMRGSDRKGPRPYTAAAREGNWGCATRNRPHGTLIRPFGWCRQWHVFRQTTLRYYRRSSTSADGGAGRAGWPAWPMASHRSYPPEVLRLAHLAQAVEFLIDARPTRQLLHVGEPALNVRIGREVTADELPQCHDAATEIVRDGDLIAT